MVRDWCFPVMRDSYGGCDPTIPVAGWQAVIGQALGTFLRGKCLSENMAMSNEYLMTDLLTLIVADRAEGMNLHTGHQPLIYLGGEPHVIAGPPITPENGEALFRSLATTRQIRELRAHGTVEFIYTFQGATQFRVQARLLDERLQLELERVLV